MAIWIRGGCQQNNTPRMPFFTLCTWKQAMICNNWPFTLWPHGWLATSTHSSVSLKLILFMKEWFICFFVFWVSNSCRSYLYSVLMLSSLWKMWDSLDIQNHTDHVSSPHHIMVAWSWFLLSHVNHYYTVITSLDSLEAWQWQADYTVSWTQSVLA